MRVCSETACVVSFFMSGCNHQWCKTIIKSKTVLFHNRYNIGTKWNKYRHWNIDLQYKNLKYIEVRTCPLVDFSLLCTDEKSSWFFFFVFNQWTYQTYRFENSFFWLEWLCGQKITFCKRKLLCKKVFLVKKRKLFFKVWIWCY